MKFSKSIMGFALVSALFVGCKDTASKPVTADSATTEKKVIAVATRPETATFNIEGMTCSMGCAKTIEEKLAEMDGVQNVKVDFETKTATVNFDLDKLQTTDLTKAVEGCADGKTYKVSTIKTGTKG
ncbi:MAG: heavy-metal-associated domain-containing protein [Bacteroidota bacterium]